MIETDIDAVRTAAAGHSARDSWLLLGRFEDQVVRTPDRTALICDGRTRTYAEVDDAATQLARRLVADGIGPEDRVVVAVARSFEAVVAPLAIFKAGAVYLPLDVAVPLPRLFAIVDDAKPAVAIVDAESATQLTISCRRIVLNKVLDEADGSHAFAPLDPDERSSSRVTPASAAYIIYTSGSTGTPKGVVVEHSALGGLLRALGGEQWYGPADRVLAITTTAFDVSLVELLAPLCVGATVVMATHDQARDPEKARRLAVEHDATVVVATPSYWTELLDGAAAAFNGRRLVSTGEPLSASLAKDLLAASADVWNLYGPTEATVWATAHQVTAVDLAGDEGISIGRALAHCHASVLDDQMNPVAVGTIGELFLGGPGVARGYLNRPSLTARSFLPDSRSGNGAVVYRTGDRVRQRANGTLEFAGRTDRQVKLRGFRIELGEIEAALRRDPRVMDALVTVDGAGAERRLTGYVVPRRDADARQAAVEEWRDLHESIYGEESSGEAGDFNLAGWVSSYTGQPMGPDLMRAWVDETVATLRAFAPTAVLEIGCGTGLLLTRLAPHVARYIGVDFSAEAVTPLRRYAAGRPDLAHVEVRQAAAEDLAFVADASVDLVVINSVMPYFPDVDYLLDVLDQAARVTKTGGRIFIGDVRSLPLLEAFHTSVQLFQAADDVSVSELRRRVAHAMHHEVQLLAAADLFLELARHHPSIGRAEIRLKPGAYENENSLFRYDVVLEVGAKAILADPQHWLAWDRTGEWRGELARRLAAIPNASVGVRGIPDRRVGGAVAAARALHVPGDRADAAAIRAHARQIDGEYPYDVCQTARDLDVDIAWRGFDANAVYDVVYRPTWVDAETQPPAPRSYYRRFTNTRVDFDGAFGAELRRSLLSVLPDHMVPSAIVVLESLPLSATGKLDLQALPKPVLRRRDDSRPPRTTNEATLCELFADVLGLDAVGIDDDFFELGGHSLLATRLLNRLRSRFAVDLPLRALFDSRSVSELARRLPA